jgi:hypothetical protein
MVILRATNDDGVKVDLDVLEADQPILLDISAIENTEIGDVLGISSQTFSLPGTDKNNQFFGNLFNLGATPSIALQDSIPCQVLTDGQAVFTGRLYITDIVTDQKGYTTYQVNIVNETIDFKFLLTDTLLTQLDWSAYNHLYTYGNITSSWDGLIANGDIVYPHVDYGRAEDDEQAPTYEFSNNPSSVTFDNSTKPLRVIDFKPAIRARAVLDTLFSSVGYEYTSSFINSAYFSNIYLLTTPNDGIGVQNENPTTGSFYAYRATSNQVFNALADTLINFNAELYDDFNRYDLVNDEFTTYVQGQYGFSVAFNFNISNYNLDNRLRFVVTLKDDLGNQIAGRTFVDPPQSGQLIAPFPLVNLATGRKVKAFVRLLTDDGTEVVTIGFGENNTYFTLYSAPKSTINANVDMGEQFPDNFKALDFLQGLIEKFNLVIEPVPGTRNVLRIEPFQDWIDQGATKDWTNKVDRNERFQIVHPITEQPKTIIFSDESDTDAINQYTVERFDNVYGTYIYTNDSDLCIGERKIGKTFAATPVKNIPNSNDFIIPMLHKRESGQEPRPFAFKPRLLYANGKKNVPAEAFGSSLGLNGAPPRGIIRGTYFFQDEVGTIHREYFYYQMTTYEDLPTSNTSRDLHFGNRKNPGWWPYFQPNVNGYTANSAYHYYWETYINSLYDIDARKLTCNVYLEPTEIQNIALNDKYFIDGAYYRINKISGANLTYRDTVQIEFIKQLNRQITYPRRRVFDALNDRFVDIQVREENANGTVVYEFSDTGVVVNDYNLIIQAAPKDGYAVFNTAGTGSVAWDTIPPSDIPLARQISPGNQVDSVATRINVNGTNNAIKQNATDITINGTSNTIGEFTDTVLISGFDNVVDIDQSNLAIIAGTTSSILNGTDNSVIIGGSGSYISNGDWVIDINGFSGGILDSDNTVAINRAEDEVIINGSGHTVIGLNLEGDGLDLLNTRNNSNWLGDTYFGEAQFIVPQTLNIGDGTNISLTGTNPGQGRHESLYILNWNGLSPGTASIELPSYTNNDYTNIVYTFKANGTFDGTTYLELSGFSGQTIEGNSTYAFSGSNEYVQLIATPTNWLILNASGGSTGAPGPSGSNTINVQYTSSLVNVANTLNFTGSGVTVTSTNGTAIIDITGGTSVSASFATSASFAQTASYALNAPNIYNSDGSLTGGRNVILNSNNLSFVADQGETFAIESDPTSQVQITNLLEASQSMVVGYNSATGQLTAMNTSSFGGGGGGNTFPFTGSAIITGSLTTIGSVVTSGSARGEYQTLNITSNTASLNCLYDYYTLTLPSGSTHISASNVNPGQTISIIVTTPSAGSGSVSFSSNIKTILGAGYTPTSGASRTDVITFISTPVNELLMIPSNNFL